MVNHENSKGAQPINENHESAGWKHLPDQFTSYPFLGHLYFTNKKDLLFRQNEKELASFATQLCGDRMKYKQFLRQKSRYPSYDIYACFQPFNEAFKAMFPFVQYIKEHIKNGDIILNLWDRSGWTASMLAGWFPQNHIVTVWEGDKDILGYRGFDYWMSPERRHNHSVIFADFERPLPFGNNSISAIIGMDVLHRFNQPEFISEINRIAKAQAPIIFPHVHLTNNVPEPFFDRGCIQLHGNEYQYFFDKVALSTNRAGYILSEPATFMWNEMTSDVKKTLVSEPANTDYNACIAWLPQAKENPSLAPWRAHQQSDWEQMFLLENPFLTVDPPTQTIQLRNVEWGIDIEEFLSRHPVYIKRLGNSVGKKVDEDVVCVLYWARQGFRLHQILSKTKLSRVRLQQILHIAYETDLAQAVPVDITGFRLQTLLGYQHYLPEEKENNLNAFWKLATSLYADEIWCRTSSDESLTYAQADELVILVQKALNAEGLKRGDKILICGEIHSEILLTFWAAASMGIVIVPLSSKQSTEKIKEYFELIEPALVITEPSLYNIFQQTESSMTIMLDQPEDKNFRQEFCFEKWLESAIQHDIQPIEIPDPDDIAVLLWTSGSTGNPKAIPITHAQLIRSGRIITETYHWKKKDKYYSLGGLETMSGLRHVTVSAAEVGACCILPEKNATIYDHVETINKEEITIITANPSFYKQLLVALRGRQRVKKLPLRLALCTGNQLSKELKKAWQQFTGIRLYNYYGLTETTGICIAEIPGLQTEENDTIGIPIDCVVKVIGEDGKCLPAGTPGELCVYGAGIFTGYYNNPQATLKVLKNGWFHTGDQVIQLTDGSLKLSGRLSDIVKLPSGQRIEMEAIDDVMKQIPDLKDWAVFPIHNKDRESIAVFLVLGEHARFEMVTINLRQAISHFIGDYALPTIIESVSHIPRGNHNKILRKELVESYTSTINHS